jgi:hypothetical protein
MTSVNAQLDYIAAWRRFEQGSFWLTRWIADSKKNIYITDGTALLNDHHNKLTRNSQ